MSAPSTSSPPPPSLATQPHSAASSIHAHATAEAVNSPHAAHAATSSPPISSSAPAVSPDPSPASSSAASSAAAAPSSGSASSPFSVSSSLSTALELKAAASAFVAAADWSRAVAKYSRIFAYVQGLRPPPGNAGAGARMALLALQATQPAGAHAVDEQQQQVIDDLLVSTNANLALCYHKLGQPQQVIKFASKALELSPQHVKALFRRGAARRELGDLDGSREDLQQALALQPTDAAIKAELAKLRKGEEKDEEKVRQRFAGMFKSPPS